MEVRALRARMLTGQPRYDSYRIENPAPDRSAHDQRAPLHRNYFANWRSDRSRVSISLSSALPRRPLEIRELVYDWKAWCI
jgi:hypothetical protein